MKLFINVLLNTILPLFIGFTTSAIFTSLNLSGSYWQFWMLICIVIASLVVGFHMGSVIEKNKND